eukprot:gene14676-19714_t
MGSGMAANLAKAGHRVFAYDLTPAALEAAVAAGCEASPSVAQAVAQADFVVTMLPTGAHVLDVYQGPDGVFAHVRPNAALIDCSTISVDDARAVGEAARAKGLGAALFDTNKSDVKAQFAGTLDQIAATLRDNPNTIVCVIGYTDSTGSDQYNQDLSVRRAQSVTNFLTAKGISGARLTAAGLGE